MVACEIPYPTQQIFSNMRRSLHRAFCIQRDRMDFDMVIVGGGPAGLACAIRAKQINPNFNVCIVEKGSEIGSHIVSGNVFEPRALNELIPDWRAKDCPVRVSVTDDKFYILPNDSTKISIPTILFPKELHNEGNYIISLGELCKWLAAEAESLGVEIYPGFAVADPIMDSDDRMIGVRTVDTGIAKDGKHKANYNPGMDLMGKSIVLAEGARGSVTEKVISHYNLRKNSLSPPTYSLGLKEVWEIDPSKHKPGSVSHAVGYPLPDWSTYGGSFVYHMDNNLVHLGLVIGLDYTNPYMNTYSTFQLLKKHGWIRDLIQGGKCVSYAARVLNVGGYQALPELSFPGGAIVGCSAGLLNLPKIKGTHTAMKSGMIAGEVFANGNSDYSEALQSSWVFDELYRVRNMKPAFKIGGMLGGMSYGGLFLNVFRGKEPWTLKWSGRDCDKTKQLSANPKPIEYTKPDNIITFDILDNLIRTGVKHEHDQPSHLKIKPDLSHVPKSESVGIWGGPEARFCPAKVYEYPEGVNLQINAQNCIHCKCCSIKTPEEYIEWTVPEGGGGPQYSGM
jgi:electron-transferring-flavoprotein dehydrogenase